MPKIAIMEGLSPPRPLVRIERKQKDGTFYAVSVADVRPGDIVRCLFLGSLTPARNGLCETMEVGSVQVEPSDFRHYLHFRWV